MLLILSCVLVMSVCACSCGNEEETIIYNDEEAVAEGTVNLSGEEPKINITNIKAKKGAIIDYLSNVIIEDEQKYEDLRVWVDESAVDIYEAGDYKAKYTFEYGDKRIVYEIIVTIIDDEDKEEAGDTAPTKNQQANVGGDNTPGQSETKPVGGNDNKPSGGENVESSTTSPAGGEDKESSTTKPIGGGDKESSTTKPIGGGDKESSTTKPIGGGTNEEKTTKPISQETESTRKELITSSGSGEDKQEDIGYSYIELLSGSTVSIKSTTTRYIVSTRTDISYVTKNNIKYKVSKLIIRYNTGEERTLETVEEKCN